MAGDSKSDVLMMFTLADGTPLPGDGTSKVDGDRMMDGFKAGGFFEVQGFNLSLKLIDEDEAAEDGGGARGGAGAGGAPASRTHHPIASGTGAAARPTPTNPLIGATDFRSWRNAQPNDAERVLRQAKYRARMPGCKVDRLMDRASPTLFKYCCDSITMRSATIVKRRSTGRDVAMQGMLRFTFDDVLITSVEWENDAIIKETCEFIFKKMEVVYRRQRSDGGFGDAGGGGRSPRHQAEWKQENPDDETAPP